MKILRLFIMTSLVLVLKTAGVTSVAAQSIEVQYIQLIGTGPTQAVFEVWVRKTSDEAIPLKLASLKTVFNYTTATLSSGSVTFNLAMSTLAAPTSAQLGYITTQLKVRQDQSPATEASSVVLTSAFQLFGTMTVTSASAITYPLTLTPSSGGNPSLQAIVYYNNSASSTALALSTSTITVANGSQFILPIKLTTFSAEQYNTTASKLDWTTTSEENSDFFGIERSEDGINWSEIGIVKAAGNSSEILEYRFIDNKLPLSRTRDQVFYYRLRMTDLDGKFSYSDIRGVNFSRKSDLGVSIYPNPTAELINVDLSGLDTEAGDINLSLYDNSARQVLSKKIIGNGIELIDVSNLPTGTYNVFVQQGDIRYQKSVIKID